MIICDHNKEKRHNINIREIIQRNMLLVQYGLHQKHHHQVMNILVNIQRQQKQLMNHIINGLLIKIN